MNTKLTPKRINRRSFLKTSAGVGVAGEGACIRIVVTVEIELG
jgi:hypothetical protein